MELSTKENKIKKEDVILFILIFIFSIITNNAFLQKHYSSDTMCLIDLGYFCYPLKFFLLDGRIFSSLLCFLSGILNIPIDIYLFISNFIGLLLLALTTTVLFKFSIKYLKIDNKWIKVMVLFSTYTIIFNHMDIEYLIYQESCVMCAGVLFSVLAAISYLKDRRSIIKAFGLLVLSTLCYQGVLSIFPTLVIALSLLRKKNTKKEISKIYVKEVLKLGIMYILVMLISAGIIFLFNSILNSSSNRLERIKDIFEIIHLIPKTIINVLLLQSNLIPIFLSVIVMFVTIMITIKNNNLTYKYILTMLVAYMFCMLPIVIFGYVRARLLMAIGATMGISLLFITKVLNDEEDNGLIKKIKTIVLSIFVISYFIFNVINNTINGYEHLKAFKIDEKIGANINQIVKDYEEKSGYEIVKFSYTGDSNVQAYENGIKMLGPLTERKFAVPIKESLNYYCNKTLEKVPFSSNVYYEKFSGKNYTEFSEEQLVFIEDTLYMCIY